MNRINASFDEVGVLNLIINGIPSIQLEGLKDIGVKVKSFKPYYKWNTFNTKMRWLL